MPLYFAKTFFVTTAVKMNGKEYVACHITCCIILCHTFDKKPGKLIIKSFFILGSCGR